MMGRKAARNIKSRNTNKIGIQCICWSYSQGMCYDARSYDLKMCRRQIPTAVTTGNAQVQTPKLATLYPPWPAVSVAFCRSSSFDRVAVPITEKHQQLTRNIKHCISNSALKFLIHK